MRRRKPCLGKIRIPRTTFSLRPFCGSFFQCMEGFYLHCSNGRKGWGVTAQIFSKGWESRANPMDMKNTG